MLKKLRHKFVFTNMAVVTIVVLVALCSAWGVILHLHDEALRKAMEDGLRSPGSVVWLGNPTRGEKSPGDGQSADGQTSAQQNVDSPAENALSDVYSLNPASIAVYELRDGRLVSLSSGGVSLSSEAVAQVEAGADGLDEGFGTSDELGLYYLKETSPDGATRIAFADKTSSDRSLRSLVFVLVGMGVFIWAACLAVSVFLSFWATRPVKEAWEQQQRFVADASHELKTPLSVILANNAILMSHPEKSVGEQIRWVESTQAEGEMMQELVGDLLFLAQPAPAHGETVGSRLDLSELVDRNLLQFESVAYERGITLESDVDRDVFVFGSASRVQRLVGTLMDNACKYAERPGRVLVELDARKKVARLSVSNTGTPIAEEDREHIFERFYRADKARSRDETGYGLGLSIARDVCTELGGTLELSNRAGWATTLTAELPVA
ncbi:MAG: sensor histidine kinase [Coriobacteriales bacterium]